MTARVQCAALYLHHGQRRRCQIRTALRHSVVRLGSLGERLFLPDGLPDIGRFPVCSQHTAIVERQGYSAIDILADDFAVPA